MENKSEVMVNGGEDVPPIVKKPIVEVKNTETLPEGKLIKTINLSGDQIIVTDELPGVYCKGVQYYDFKNIHFINNMGMANLIGFIKTLLEKNIDVQFINVNERIKLKIKSMGLEHILHCG